MAEARNVGLEFTEPTRVFVTAQGSKDSSSFGAERWGVRESVQAGDAVLFYVAGESEISHVARAVSDASRSGSKSFAEADFDPGDYLEFSPGVSLEQLRGHEVLGKWPVVTQKLPFTNLDSLQAGPVEGVLREALLKLIELGHPDFLDWLGGVPRLWVTAGDKSLNERLADLQIGEVLWWAVPEACRHGDYSLLWVNRVGFRYILRAVGSSRPPTEQEHGPQQSRHRVVGRLEQPLKMAVLRKDAVLGKWNLVGANMQGPAAKLQDGGVLEDPQIWAALRGHLVRLNPDLEPLLQAIEAPTLGTQGNVLRSRLPGYASDVATGKRDSDLLDLQAEFRTLATLLAAKAVLPPLALGLFGDWGSGKSFYIKQVQREVDEIAKLARSERERDPKTKIDFLQDIFQIEFNAWHYSDGDLWASLVDHLFTSLRDGLRRRRGKGKQEEADRELRNLLSELETTDRAGQAAQEQMDELDTRIDAAEKEVDRARKALADSAASLARAQRTDLWKGVTINAVKQQLRETLQAQAAAHGFAHLATDARQLVALAQRTRGVGGRGQALWRSVRRAGLGPWQLGFLLLVLVGAWLAGPVISAIAGTWDLEALGRFFPSITQLLVLVGGLLKWIPERARWLDDRLTQAESFLDTVEEAAGQVEKRLRNQELRRDGEIVKAESEIARLRVELEAAQRQQSEAQTRQIQLLSQIERRQPERRLADFIEERANSKDYREKLGILALVRRDFERLSDLLTLQSRPSLIPEDVQERLARKTKGPLPSIERIILYIDDLDRCLPDKVVEVLRAVHLLLAFDLFIVVVAVDARWVSRSLEIEHEQLLVSDHRDPPAAAPSGAPAREPGKSEKAPRGQAPRTTSADYLEKIFQVPYWLPEFSGRAARRMVHKLLRSQLDESGEPSDHAGQTLPEREVEPFTMPELDEPSARQQRVLPETFDPTPEGLSLTREELQVLIRLAPLAGETPRQIKRFTNLYRLVKTGLGERELDEFLGRNGNEAGFPAAAVLLAIFTGAPRATTELLDLVELVGTRDPGISLRSFSQDLLWRPKNESENKKDPLIHAERKLVNDNLEVRVAANRLLAVARATDLGELGMERLMTAIPATARYSFAGRREAARTPAPA